jgi:hypothetical protein
MDQTNQGHSPDSLWELYSQNLMERSLNLHSLSEIVSIRHPIMSTRSSITAFLLFVGFSTCFAGERFVSTLGTVSREISADKVAFTLRVKAIDQTTEASIAKLEKLLVELFAEAKKLNYPESAFTIKSRATEREREWDANSRTQKAIGFNSYAVLSVILTDLSQYGKLQTYLGTHEGFDVIHVTLGSSKEGEARKQVITEALRAAKEKAALLVAEGGETLGKLLEVTEEEVETRSFNEYSPTLNRGDPNEGKGLYPIGIFVRVKAKYEIK